MQRKKTLTLLLLGLATSTLAYVGAGSPAAAAPRPDEAAASRAYLHSHNVPGHGVAIEGYSPVSYFEGRAERGSALFAVEHDGITYHLTGAAQAEAFRRDPARYVPAYGGWCAFGMAVQDKFPVDPTSFAIVDGKLLLFLRNAAIDARALWNEQRDEAQLLRKADAHWRKVQG